MKNKMIQIEKKPNTVADSSSEIVSKHGGKRVGAGRKPLQGVSKTKYVAIRLTESEAKNLKQWGGSNWVRLMLAQTEKPFSN